MLQKIKLLLVISLSILFLQACGGDGGDGGGEKFGTLNTGSPEYAAVTFFNSIYKDKNINTALSLSSDKMTRVLKSYRSNRNVQRHVIGLRYDTVKLEIDSGGGNMRGEFADKSRITVLFSGMLHGDKIEDLRTVYLVRVDKKWKVDSISDKY